MYISVIGSGECGVELAGLATRVGAEVARRGHVLVCGGLGGVMDAAARGATGAGGASIGILPGDSRAGASSAVAFSLPTAMGEARNALVVRAGDAVIAVGGGYGTLSEIALALKMDKPVVGLETWEASAPGQAWGVRRASSAAEAVELAVKLAEGSS